MEKIVSNDVERMTVTRVFDAPRELVWKAWTDPKYVVQWWGPKGCSSPSCTADFREGGKFLYSMKLPDGQVFYTGGEYHEIVPPEKVVFSMYFADAQGNKVQPEQLGFDHEAIAGAPDVVTFEDLGNGQTRLTYVGNETMADATASGQTEGTRQSLDKLAAVVAELAQAK